MDKDLKDYIAARCEKELLKNNEFKEVQKKLSDSYTRKDIETYSELSLRMQIIIETTCYKVAVKDIHSLVIEQ